MRHLQEKQDGKLATQGAKILTAAAASGYEAANHVFNVALGFVMERYFVESDQPHREILLRMLINFAKATAHFEDQTKEHPLAKYHNQLYVALQNAITSSRSDQEVIEAIEGIAVVANLRGGLFLDSERVAETVELMVQCLVGRTTSSASVHLAALTALTALSLRHPQAALTHAVTPLLRTLSQRIEISLQPSDSSQMDVDTASIDSTRASTEDLVSWVHTLCDPSSLKSLQGPSGTSLHVSGDASVVAAVQAGFIELLGRFFHVEYVTSKILASLAQTVATQSVFLRIFAVVVEGFATSAQAGQTPSDFVEASLRAVYRWMPDLAAHATSSLPPSEQHALVVQMFNGFNAGDLTSVLGGLSRGGPGQIFRPFADDAPEFQRHLVPVCKNHRWFPVQFTDNFCRFLSDFRCYRFIVPYRLVIVV